MTHNYFILELGAGFQRLFPHPCPQEKRRQTLYQWLNFSLNKEIGRIQRRRDKLQALVYHSLPFVFISFSSHLLARSSWLHSRLFPSTFIFFSYSPLQVLLTSLKPKTCSLHLFLLVPSSPGSIDFTTDPSSPPRPSSPFSSHSLSLPSLSSSHVDPIIFISSLAIFSIFISPYRPMP